MSPVISFRLPLLLAAMVLVGGCHGSRAMPAGMDGLDSRAPNLRVVNRNEADMYIYAMRGNVRVRLGLVNSMSERSYRIPEEILASAQGLVLVAQPLGDQRDFRSPPVMAGRRDFVEWRIQGRQDYSDITVRPRDP